jgi:hypothetical protein
MRRTYTKQDEPMIIVLALAFTFAGVALENLLSKWQQ